MADIDSGYRSDPTLKRQGIVHNFTENEVQEYVKCMNDPIYFIENYMTVIHVDRGIVPFKLYDFQKEMILAIHENRHTAILASRQCGKSVTTIGYILWLSLFKADQAIAILANKGQLARDLLDRYQLSYSGVPHFLQQGVVTWQKGKVELENNSQVFASSTSANALRGSSINFLYCDEFAFVHNNMAEAFFNSTYPVISSGESTKLVISSCVVKDTYIFTPNGIRQVNDYINYNIPSNPNVSYNIPRYNVYGMDGIRSGEYFCNNGKSKTKIITSTSATLECSLEHKLWAYKDGKYDWCKAKELTENDYISIKYGENIWGNSPPIEYDTKDYDRIPNQLFSCSRITVITFLDKLFCNQGLKYSTNKVEFVSYSKELVLQIRILLLNLGILSEYKLSVFHMIEISDKDSYLRFIDTFENLTYNTPKHNLKWEKIKSITESENEVYDFSLDHIDGDKWCHSVIYNGIVGHQTPNGMNHFYKIWTDAVSGRNGYKPVRVHWNDVPGRDEKFKEEFIKSTSHRQWSQEMLCDFLGSTNTLISGEKLACLAYKQPINTYSGMVIYEEPVKESVDEDTLDQVTKDHLYVICVDVSEGKGLDYSAFSVFDVSTMPYRQVAIYRNNGIPPILYPTVIKACAEYYNNAHVLIEINNNPQIADILILDLEYENVFKVASGNKRAQTACLYGGRNVAYGLKMTALVKRIGCSNLKTLVENDKLIIQDFETISELTTFVQEGPSFKAEEGCNDDLAMGLVIFSWLTSQKLFKDIVQHDLRRQLQLEHFNFSEEDQVPIGKVSTGLEVEHFIEDNAVWIATSDRDPYKELFKQMHDF